MPRFTPKHRVQTLVLARAKRGEVNERLQTLLWIIRISHVCSTTIGRYNPCFCGS